MEKSVCLLVFLSSLEIVFAVPFIKPGVRIINGKSAEPGQFLFIIALQDGTGQFCDGSIINSKWIITAGHCVEGLKTEYVQILAGTNRIHTGGTIYNIARVIYHPDYNSTSIQNDIGLVKVDGEIEFNDLVQPINIGYAESNDTVIAAGWGVAENTDFPEDLRYIELRALSLEECQERAQNYMEDLYLGPEQVCALANDKGACYGDSGGPLTSNEKLVGIVSYGFLPCGKGVPDVYTRPSVYTEWITQIIQE